MPQVSLTRIISLVLAVCAVVVLLPAVAAAESDEQETAGQTTEPGEELFTLVDEEALEEQPVIGVGDIEPGLDEATALLEENFSYFLDREELGFDTTLFELLLTDALNLYAATSELAEDPAAHDLSPLVDGTIILVIIALFLVFFLLIDRQAVHFAHRVQAHTHFDISRWLTLTARKAILVAGRSLAFLALIALSFFPIRATFGTSAWTLLLTDVLLLLLLYRVIKTFLLTTLRLNPRDLEMHGHFARVERFGMVVLRVTVFFSIFLAAIDRFDYHDQMANFVVFSFRVTLPCLVLYLLLTRDSVLALLPEPKSSRLYRSLHFALVKNYYLVLGVTIVLLLFNAAGYVDVATFLLTRGYALIVVAALWFAALERLHHLVIRRAREAEKADGPPSPLLKALEHWLIAIGSFVIIVVSLRLLGIFEPIQVLLQIPLISVGHLDISAYNLINVALIIVGTVLSIRLFKALLNAKIYPAFNVDVGAAYATNTIINYVLVVVAFILCLVALGVHLSAVMVVMASLGVGIGFGLQNIAENLISGFILLFGRAVKKGDFITVNDLYGRVEAVGARSVVVRTPDNFSMLIPSKEIVSGRIVNWTFHDSIVRIHVPVGVSYDSDPTQVQQVLLESAHQHPDILEEPSPDVWIVEFGDNSIQFELLVYFDCRTTNEQTLKGKFNFILWNALQNADIEIPFPQRDLHLKSGGEVADFGKSRQTDKETTDED